MEKMKAFLTQKVNKNTFKDVNVKRAIKLTLCGALIVALMIQAIGCFFAPMSAYAAEDDSIVGTWVLDVNSYYTDVQRYQVDGTFYSNINSNTVEYHLKYFIVDSNSVYLSNYNIGVDTSYPQYYTRVQNAQYVVCTSQTNSSQSSYKTYNWDINSDIGQSLLVFSITGGTDITNVNFITWLKANATKQVTDVYDFTGETRLFYPQLTRPPMVQADVEQYVYKFDFKVYGGYTADYFIIGRSLNEWEVAYSFIDEGSGGITTMYRQQFNQSEGRWLRPRNRLIEFISNPEDPDLQQWLLDNTVLVDNTSVGIGYDYGYDIGYNDGWTNSAIGDTLKAPVDALNGVVLLQTADVTITLGGVIFTMVVLSIMLIFLKKYAGG